MAFVDKPAVVKGTPTLLTLTKASLAADALFTAKADAYMEDLNNWKTVIFFYKETIGGQSAVVSFNCDDGATPQAGFGVSSLARNVFQIDTITVIDNDGGKAQITRSEILTAGREAEFDYDLAPIVAAYYENLFELGGSINGAFESATLGTYDAGNGGIDYSLAGGAAGDFVVNTTSYDIDQSKTPINVATQDVKVTFEITNFQQNAAQAYNIVATVNGISGNGEGGHQVISGTLADGIFTGTATIAQMAGTTAPMTAVETVSVQFQSAGHPSGTPTCTLANLKIEAITP